MSRDVLEGMTPRREGAEALVKGRTRADELMRDRRGVETAGVGSVRDGTSAEPAGRKDGAGRAAKPMPEADARHVTVPRASGPRHSGAVAAQTGKPGAIPDDMPQSPAATTAAAMISRTFIFIVLSFLF